MQSKIVKDSLNTKKMSIMVLSIIAIFICLSGVIFGVYCWVNNITFKVLNTNVPGIIFAALVIYLGVRYFLSVSKLKKELYKESSTFSWGNFRKQKVAK
ncbi:MAG TPA: hypothetical protein VIK78_14750 [Ruminiclostridium sp.]